MSKNSSIYCENHSDCCNGIHYETDDWSVMDAIAISHGWHQDGDKWTCPECQAKEEKPLKLKKLSPEKIAYARKLVKKMAEEMKPKTPTRTCVTCAIDWKACEHACGRTVFVGGCKYWQQEPKPKPDFVEPVLEEYKCARCGCKTKDCREWLEWKDCGEGWFLCPECEKQVFSKKTCGNCGWAIRKNVGEFKTCIYGPLNRLRWVKDNYSSCPNWQPKGPKSARVTFKDADLPNWAPEGCYGPGGISRLLEFRSFGHINEWMIVRDIGFDWVQGVFLAIGLYNLYLQQEPTTTALDSGVLEVKNEKIFYRN